MKVTQNIWTWIGTAAVAVVMALGIGDRVAKEVEARKQREEQGRQK